MSICNCILTYSGRYVDVLDPDPDTISITDIAHALSQTNRFGGHTRTIYTVAQHSVMVSYLVPVEYRLAGLLHDAAEAYFGDMVYPVKYMPSLMEGYRDAESMMQSAIFKKFGLGVQDDICLNQIRIADLIMLATERRDLMAPESTPWPILNGVVPQSMRIKPLMPMQAEAQFINRFKTLSGVL